MRRVVGDGATNMARTRKGVAKRKRGCWMCKPWRAAGNGQDRTAHPERRRDPLGHYRHVGHRLALEGRHGQGDYED
jgi:hypothetical protein